MSIEFGILNYAVLLLVAQNAKRDNETGFMIGLAFAAHAILIWGIVNWIRSFL